MGAASMAGESAWQDVRVHAEVEELRLHGDLAPPEAGDVLVTSSMGPTGDLVALWCSAEGAAAMSGRTMVEGGASFPDTRLPRAVPARVSFHAPGLTRVVTLANLALAYPDVQALPDGAI